jgi:uncharacterized protein
VICYVDTSALAKRYLNEWFSDAVDTFLMDQSLLLVTTLTTIEMKNLLSRRWRMGELDPSAEMRVFSTYLDNVRQGFIAERDVSREMFQGAVHLLGQLPDVPLRTLDALHIAAHQQLGADILVTADQHMREAAKALDITAKYFGE